MSKETLLILGGNVYTYPAIASLKKNGYRIVVIDGDPHAPAFDIADVAGKFSFRDVARCISLAKKENIKAVIPTHDRAVIPAAHISSSLSLKGPSLESAICATSKKMMREAWKKAGLPSPDIKLASNPGDFANAVRKIGFPAICKPTDDVGGGSRGISRIDEKTDLEETYRFATSFSDSGEVLVEHFYTGLEHSVEILMREGEGTVLMVSDKVKTDPPYRVDKSVIYPTSLSEKALERLSDLSIAATKALGLKDGAAHLELCTLADGSNILFEIGLRCGGGLTPHPIAELVTGVNQFVEYAEILLGRNGRRIAPIQPRGTVFHFITASPGKLAAIHGADKAGNLPGIIDMRITAKPGDVIKEVRTSSDRLGYILSTGKTGAEAYALAISAENNLRFIYEEEP